MLASDSFGPLLRILLVFVLVHFPWPGLGQHFASYFSGTSAPLLGLFAAPDVQLELCPAPAPPWTVLIKASNQQMRRGAGAELDVRRVGWLPLGVFVALLAAFPVRSWKERAKVAALGLTVIHALWVLPVLASFGDSRAGFFELGRIAFTGAVLAQRALVMLPGMAYALPALLWFVLTWSFERGLM